MINLRNLIIDLLEKLKGKKFYSIGKFSFGDWKMIELMDQI